MGYSHYEKRADPVRRARNFPHPANRKAIDLTKPAIGFYWTLPVPWAGFAALPPDIDEAAKLSRTIRYWLLAIRACAKAEAYRLIHEEALLELEPDRGTDIILVPLAKVERLCRANGAVLLYVDFREVQGWRRLGFLNDWMKRTGIRTEPIPPEAMPIDGKTFDPQAHFTDWRQRQHEWMEHKAARAEAGLGRARRLRNDGLSYPAIAQRMTAEGLPSLTGKACTAENLRKFMEKMEND